MHSQALPTLGKTIGMPCIDNGLKNGDPEETQRLSSALERLCILFLFVTGWRNVHQLAVSTQQKLPRALHTAKLRAYFQKVYSLACAAKGTYTF